MTTIEIRHGNDWLAGMDEENYYVKFVGRPEDIETVRNMVLLYNYETGFKTLEEFAKFVRALDFKFCSVCSRAE
jgi:hypothetical protein